MRRPGWRGFMLSIAVGGLRRVAASSSSPVDARGLARARRTPPTGKVTSRGRDRAQRPPGQDGAVVGRRHEDHPLDEGQGREEHRLLEERAGLGD